MHVFLVYLGVYYVYVCTWLCYYFSSFVIIVIEEPKR